MSSSIVTAEDINTILENKLETKTFEYVSHNVRSLQEEVEGYLSDHYSLEIKYKTQENIQSTSFFLKIRSKNKGFLGDLSDSMRVFPFESFMYKTVFSEFENMENTGEFAPKCYLVNDNKIVLEDLISQGYKTIERLHQYNLVQCKVFLETLSKFHARSIVFEAKNTRWVEKYKSEFEEKFFYKDKTAPTMKYYYNSLKNIRDLIEELPEDLLDRNEFKVFFDKEFSELAIDDPIVQKYSLCLTHCDLWSNNIMYKYEGDSIIACKIVDYQICRYGAPGFDVIQFLYANTTLEFRKHHQNHLTEFYYGCLQKEMLYHGYNIKDYLSYQDLLDGITLLAPLAKQMTISDLVLLYLPKDEVEKEIEDSVNFYYNLLVVDKSKYVVPAFKNNPICNEHITSELLDLRDILVQKRQFIQRLKGLL